MDAVIPDSQPFLTEVEELEELNDDQNENFVVHIRRFEERKRRHEDFDEGDEQSQSILPSIKLQKNSNPRTDNLKENTKAKDSDLKSEASDNDIENGRCNLCLFEKELDKRNYYFGNLLIGELQFLPPCMRSEAYINILKYVDSLKERHRKKLDI